MDVSLSDYQEMLADARGAQLVHFDEIDAEDDNEPFLDRNSVTSGSDPLEQLKDARFKKSLVAAIEGLPEREKMLMGLYYEQELNFKEIAAVLGVTESRICQLHSQAVARIRVKLKDW